MARPTTHSNLVPLLFVSWCLVFGDGGCFLVVGLCVVFMTIAVACEYVVVWRRCWEEETSIAHWVCDVESSRLDSKNRTFGSIGISGYSLKVKSAQHATIISKRPLALRQDDQSLVFVFNYTYSDLDTNLSVLL